MSQPVKQYISDLKDGVVAASDFRITDIQNSITKHGKPYSRFKLSDKTGTLAAVFWDANPGAELKDGGIYHVEGDVGTYQSNLQVKVQLIGPRRTEGEHEFEKCTKYDINSMWDQIVYYISSFKSHQIKLVAEELFLSSGYQDHFRISPAATGMHHAFKGGLLEHTVQMAECADTLLKLPFFSPLNRDLCLFGILFHDFGKIFEYSSDAGFKKTLQGILVPHIPMMGALILETCNKFGVPEIIRDHLMHVVLAHHRTLEWGSPVVPSVPEAMFVHYVDNLHGDVFGALQKIEANPGKELVEHWNNGKFYLVGQSFNVILNQIGEQNAALVEASGL